MRELILTRAPLRCGSDAEPNGGSPPEADGADLPPPTLRAIRLLLNSEALRPAFCADRIVTRHDKPLLIFRRSTSSFNIWDWGHGMGASRPILQGKRSGKVRHGP